MRPTDQFMYECQEEGVNPWNEWQALLEDALEQLVALARGRGQAGEGWVSLPDAIAITEPMAKGYGKEAVDHLAMQALSYGLGKQTWDIRFYEEDGTEVPMSDVRREMEAHEKLPEGTPWVFGRDTIVKWVLKG